MSFIDRLVLYSMRHPRRFRAIVAAVAMSGFIFTGTIFVLRNLTVSHGMYIQTGSPGSSVPSDSAHAEQASTTVGYHLNPVSNGLANPAPPTIWLDQSKAGASRRMLPPLANAAVAEYWERARIILAESRTKGVNPVTDPQVGGELGTAYGRLIERLCAIKISSPSGPRFMTTEESIEITKLVSKLARESVKS